MNKIFSDSEQAFITLNIIKSQFIIIVGEETSGLGVQRGMK